ncbi:MAG: fatty acid desaturase, partial [Candidatus Carbobacillus altaicus]|nr:fatty acid desaturase [Candidatus Carbobacillus altaicus]
MSLQQNNWQPLLKPYARPSVHKSIGQIVSVALPIMMIFLVAAHVLTTPFWWIVFPLDILLSLFLVRLFILQHDAGHGSLFPKRWANDLFGSISGVFTLVPYHHWKYTHARHHATSGNLDKRGVGDIMTLTVDEYLALSAVGRLKYRLYRNPFVLFLLGPIYEFMLRYRLPLGFGGKRPHIQFSVYATDAALLLFLLTIGWAFGWWTLLLIYLPTIYFAAMFGIFLFYVQHQFEDAYWEHDPRWEYLKAAMEGSTYLKLPRVLQWLTGNIGFHHIHHLAPMIPNYELERVQREVPLVRVAPTVTLKDALKIAFIDLHLYESTSRKLI